jgi:hypothetical protein
MTRWPDWTGQTAVIVASGPSAADVRLDLGQGGARFLAVKDSWRLCPWADVLYACDAHWWEAHDGVPEFRGIKIASASPKMARWPEIMKAVIVPRTETMQFGEAGHVGWGRNSGFHAVNLAAQWGVAKIVLAGFDFRVDRGFHWFGEHAYKAATPRAEHIAQWAGILDNAAPALAARGIRVLNASPDSALMAYEKMDYEAALAC